MRYKKIVFAIYLIFSEIIISSCLRTDAKRCASQLEFGEIKQYCFQDGQPIGLSEPDCKIAPDIKLFYCYRPVQKTYTSGPATGTNYWQFEAFPNYYTCYNGYLGAGDIYKPNTFLPQECFYSLKTLNTQYVNNVVVQVEGLYSIDENATLYHTNSLNNYKSCLLYTSDAADE